MKVTKLALSALMIGSCLSSALAQSTKPPNASPLTVGAITGRVILRGKGLGGAVVTIWRQPSTEPQPGALSAKTDADGKYRIMGVSPGNYYISASAPGFVALRPARTMAISSETLDDIDFELVRGGVVSGRITDNEGKPLVEQLITLIQTDPTSDPSAISATPGSVLSSRTDDRGIYRLYGLPAGHYKVAAGLQFAAMSSFNGRPAYPRTFYPDVVDESKAKVIQISDGMEVSDVNISVGLAAKVFSISGRIVDGGTGQPVPNIQYAVNIFSNGRPRGGIGTAGLANSRGEFQVDSLPPGRYSLYLPARLTPVGTAPPNFFGESKPFDVIDHDVSDIEIRVARTATVSGFIQLEGSTDKATIARLLKMQLTVISMPKPGNRASFGTSSINSDGSFAVGGLEPGKLTFAFRPGEGEPAPFLFKRVDREGSGPGQNIEVNAGDHITNLRLIAAYASGSVRGQVKFEDGSLPPNTRLVARLYGDNPRDSANLPATFVDSRGHFLLENVPAGKYKLTVSNWTSGVRIKPVQQEIVVAEGGVSDVTVVIEPNPTPVP